MAAGVIKSYFIRKWQKQTNRSWKLVQDKPYIDGAFAALAWENAVRHGLKDGSVFKLEYGYVFEEYRKPGKQKEKIYARFQYF
jgi:SAM-dependent MidA family methyltransferase